MMEPLKAQEAAKLASLIGLFTKQPQTKSDAQRTNNARQKFFKRNSKIAKSALQFDTTGLPKKKRKKMDLKNMTKQEKRDWKAWLKANEIEG